MGHKMKQMKGQLLSLGSLCPRHSLQHPLQPLTHQSRRAKMQAGWQNGLLVRCCAGCLCSQLITHDVHTEWFTLTTLPLMGSGESHGGALRDVVHEEEWEGEATVLQHRRRQVFGQAFTMAAQCPKMSRQTVGTRDGQQRKNKMLFCRHYVTNQ